MSITNDFTFQVSEAVLIGNPALKDEKGNSTLSGTLDLFGFLSSFFRLCVEDLQVSQLDFDSDPPQGAENFARSIINGQFDNPECFGE